MLARETEPYDARAWLLLGIRDTWLGRHDSAAALMQEAITLNPSLSSAHAHLGSCYSLSGCPEDGLAMVRTALRSEENTSELQSRLRISFAVFCLKKKMISVTIPHHVPAEQPDTTFSHLPP